MNTLGYYAILALASVALFILAIALPSWHCYGNIFGSSCQSYVTYQIAGPLILAAGLVILVSGICLIVSLKTKYSWVRIMGAVTAIIGAILAGFSVYKLIDDQNAWSQFITTVAMTLSVVLAIGLVINLIKK